MFWNIQWYTVPSCVPQIRLEIDMIKRVNIKISL